MLRRGFRDQPGSRDNGQAAVALVHVGDDGAQTRLKLRCDGLRCDGIWIRFESRVDRMR